MPPTGYYAVRARQSVGSSTGLTEKGAACLGAFKSIQSPPLVLHHYAHIHRTRRTKNKPEMAPIVEQLQAVGGVWTAPLMCKRIAVPNRSNQDLTSTAGHSVQA